ncbi:hypothetical protein D3C72_1441520 [compost metagenome]
MYAVRSHRRGIQRRVVYLNHSVEQEYRDLGFFGFLQHRRPAGGDNRCNEDGVNTLSNERSDRFDLVFLFLLRIGDFQRDTPLFRFLFRNLGFRRTPTRFGTNL